MQVDQEERRDSPVYNAGPPSQVSTRTEEKPQNARSIARRKERWKSLYKIVINLLGKYAEFLNSFKYTLFRAGT